MLTWRVVILLSLVIRNWNKTWESRCKFGSLMCRTDNIMTWKETNSNCLCTFIKRILPCLKAFPFFTYRYINHKNFWWLSKREVRIVFFKEYCIPGYFLPRVFFALIHLQMVLPKRGTNLRHLKLYLPIRSSLKF